MQPSVVLPESINEEFQFESWQARHVLNWLRGLDDSVFPYLRFFSLINGRRLNGITNEQLKRLGVSKESVRSLIVAGVNLLSYYAFDIKSETAQRLALAVDVSVQNLLNSIKSAAPVISSSTLSSRSLVVLQNILGSVVNLYEDVAKLIFCLDRYPFESKDEFATIRINMASIINELVECIDDPNNPKFLSIPQILLEKGKRLQASARMIIHSNDPYVLYTAYIQRLLIPCGPENWGFEVRTTNAGIHLITKVTVESSPRIHVGDELIEVNRQAVIGWRHASVLRKLEACLNVGEFEITLSKRPRESWLHFAFQNAKITDSLTIDRRPNNEERKDSTNGECKPVEEQRFLRQRGRSASFSGSDTPEKVPTPTVTAPANEYDYQSLKSPLLAKLYDKRPLFRRASVWSVSPPAALRSPFHRIQGTSESNAWLLLLASWGNSQPNEGDPMDKYEVINVDEDAIGEVSDGELEDLNVTTPHLEDTDWSTFVKEDITGCKLIRRVHLESGSSSANIDSPLSNFHAKIAKFLYGSDVGLEQSSPTADKPDIQPLTPLSKVFTDWAFPSSSSSQPQPSPITVDTSSMSRSMSPQSPLTPSSKIVNVVFKKGRLAPLAEPDDAGDSDTLKPSSSNADDNHYDLDETPIQRIAKTGASEQREKLYEGWIRRQHSDLTSGKWIKCWAVYLPSGYLVLYKNQHAKYADIVVHLSHCQISPGTDYRPTKKHTFTLSWSGGSLSFAPYNYVDCACWIKWIEANTVSNPTATTEEVIFVTEPPEVDRCDSSQDSSRMGFLKPGKLLRKMSRRSILGRRSDQS